MTERLVLERFRPQDEDELATVFAKPAVWRFPYGRGLSREETVQFLRSQIEHWETFGFGCWVARDAATGWIVGYVGLSVPAFLPEILPAVEVGWRFDPDVWGRGLASEGALAALRAAFDILGLDRVCSVPQAENPASVRVAERIGMTFSRVVEISATDRRGPVLGSLFFVTADEWRSQTHDG